MNSPIIGCMWAGGCTNAPHEGSGLCRAHLTMANVIAGRRRIPAPGRVWHLFFVGGIGIDAIAHVLDASRDAVEKALRKHGNRIERRNQR